MTDTILDRAGMPGPGLPAAAGRIALCAAFVAAAVALALVQSAGLSAMVAVAAGFGAYMALNIGANDVANNVGPAVGARVLPLAGALVLAGLFEAAGALLAGGEVVGTIRKGIIDPALIPDARTFVWIMMAALLAGALWLNLATFLGAPVSTTHSIVGGVLGAGVAASGFGIVDWPVMTSITASWVVSPMLGAAFSAALLYLVERAILTRSDIHAAGRRAVPVMVAAMAGAFAAYLALKGLKQVVSVSFLEAASLGLVAAGVAWALMRRHVARCIDTGRPGRAAINRLLPVPLAFAAALLSFAHGSNDVANAIGPLAAIVDAVGSGGEISASAAIPFWVILTGAAGIVLGLALFGPRIIRTVGSEITRLDATRAYCIAMAAALTVIAASQLGLPVSTTHVSVGAVLGVGFLREYLRASYDRKIAVIRSHHSEADQESLDLFLGRFDRASMSGRSRMLKDLKARIRGGRGPGGLANRDRKALKKAHKSALVKRGVIVRIIAAWLVTVPATGLLAAAIFFMLRGMMLP